MKKEPEQFYDSMQEIATLFRVTRMQLYRWTKLHPFPKSFEFAAWSNPRHRCLHVAKNKLIKWAKELVDKNYHRIQWTNRHQINNM